MISRAFERSSLLMFNGKNESQAEKSSFAGSFFVVLNLIHPEQSCLQHNDTYSVNTELITKLLLNYLVKPSRS